MSSLAPRAGSEASSPDPSREQIAAAYVLMATKARYRPAAPSDGLGNITVPLEGLDLRGESLHYADEWREEENTHSFIVGCCNYPTRPATIFAIEAARSLCGVADEVARDLLRLALADLESRPLQRFP